MGKAGDGEFLTVEEFIPGDFVEFINNNAIVRILQAKLWF